MKMGRMRVRTLLEIASEGSIGSLPSAPRMKLSAWCTIRIALFTTTPIRITNPSIVVGRVVVGGLVVSTVFTLILVPLLFSLVLEMRRGFALVWTGRETRKATPADFGTLGPAGA